MKDIADKVDKLKELSNGYEHDSENQKEAIMLDFLGEVVANSRRIAGALEKIAENTKPVELSMATATLESKPLEIHGELWESIKDLAFEAGRDFKRGQQTG